MAVTVHVPDWLIVGKSVTGAAHQKQNKPCQDKYKFYKNDGVIILAVADGHGSPKSPYSDIGAELAVDVAIEVCQRFLEQVEGSGLSMSAIKRHAEEDLPRLIVKEWIQRVEDYLRNRKAQNDPEEKDKSFLIKYGSTLLTALLTSNYAIFLQLGDGDILLVDDEGNVKYPIPRDERLLGNETTSLCSPRAWDEMQTAFYILNEPLPALILLASDGYSNSFKSQQDFMLVGRDFLLLMQEHGIGLIEKRLEEWLSEVSAQGSGDDIAVCIAFKSLNHPKNYEAKPDGAAETADTSTSTDIQPVRE